MLDSKEAYLEHANDALEDDEERLAQYVHSVTRLSNLLGEEALFEQYHPLQPEFANIAPMSVKRISALVEMIEEFEDQPTFQGDILPRLRRPQQFPAARLELEVASFISGAGHSVEFLDPKAEHGSPQPDLLIDDSLPMEIKQLQWPRHMTEQNEFYGEIQNAVHKGGAPQQFRRAGSIHRALSKPEKDEFMQRIKAAIPEVRAGETVEIRETSLGEVVYEMFLAPHDREVELEEWMEEHGVEGPLSGPPQSKNDILRLKRSIAEKVGQLPEEVPGVVLIEVDPMITSEDRAEDLLGIAHALMKDVYDHEKLVSLVLFVRSSYLDVQPIALSIENVRIADFETLNDFGWRTFVTIHNKYVEDSRAKDVVDSIFSKQEST